MLKHVNDAFYLNVTNSTTIINYLQLFPLPIFVIFFVMFLVGTKKSAFSAWERYRGRTHSGSCSKTARLFVCMDDLVFKQAEILFKRFFLIFYLHVI